MKKKSQNYLPVNLQRQKNGVVVCGDFQQRNWATFDCLEWGIEILSMSGAFTFIMFGVPQ